ncbi:MAG: CheR family methyltransferase [Phycisphaerales bacterium]|nr:hypothetical protein [Planctomycetota bacterium]
MSFRSVRQWLVDRAWLDQTLLEGPGFEALVRERMRELGCEGESDYLQHLRADAGEIDRVTAAIAVPETWLFRYPASFDLLVDFLRRRRIADASSVRLLSLGCASGEEPYSIAMSALHAGWAAEQVSVDAVDRNPAAVERARAGRFGQFSLREDMPAWAVEWLVPRGEEVEVAGAVRSLVRFSVGDMMAEGLPPGSGYDVVFCRNVLIYLHAAARERLLRQITTCLFVGGMLFVGHAEPLLLHKGEFRTSYRRLTQSHAFALERVDVPPEPEIVTPTRRPAMQPVIRPVIERPAPARLEPKSEPASTLDDARALADAGKIEESESLVRTIMAKAGPSAAALELLGTLRMASQDPEQARRHFEQAVYLEPTRTTSLLQLALIREKAGDHSGATLLWERAKRAGGKN